MLTIPEEPDRPERESRSIDEGRLPDLVLRKRIGDRIRARRAVLGWSAAALSEKSGVPRNIIANFENQRTSMSVETYFALIGHLGVEPDLFMREVVCARCGGLPPQGFTCAECGAGIKGDPCMACHGDPPSGYICRACGTEAPEVASC